MGNREILAMFNNREFNTTLCKHHTMEPWMMILMVTIVHNTQPQYRPSTH
jgi:hypothetical protein